VARRSTGFALSWVALAGVIGWLCDVTVLWVLSELLHVPTALAAASGFVVAGVVNFLVNRQGFSDPDGSVGPQAARYLVLFVANLVVVTVMVPVLAVALGSLVAQSGARLVLAKLLVTACLLPVNAFFYQRWVFPA